MVLGRDRRATLITEPDDISTWNVAEVARALRRARTAQGLRVDEVGQGAGVSVKDVRALEAASLDGFPDSLSALRAVRRSADYLGLPGDQLALVLMERWPLRVARGSFSADPTSVVPALGYEDSEALRTPAAGDPTEVTKVGRRPGHSLTALFGPAAVADPGTSEVLIANGSAEAAEASVHTQAVPAVRRPSPAGSPRTRRPLRDTGAVAPDAPPAWLRVVVVVVVLAVVAGIAGIALHNLHRGPANAAGSPQAAAGARKAAAKAPAKTAFTTAQTSSTTADITVGATAFTVAISAVNNPAWIQVTAPTQSKPVFSGMLQAGQSQSFTVHQSLTVETGSTAGHATVAVGTRQVGTYVPPAAPYYMTFKAT